MVVVGVVLLPKVKGSAAKVVVLPAAAVVIGVLPVVQVGEPRVVLLPRICLPRLSVLHRVPVVTHLPKLSGLTRIGLPIAGVKVAVGKVVAVVVDLAVVDKAVRVVAPRGLAAAVVIVVEQVEDEALHRPGPLRP